MLLATLTAPTTQHIAAQEQACKQGVFIRKTSLNHFLRNL
jgi:hypothetical protein